MSQAAKKTDSPFPAWLKPEGIQTPIKVVNSLTGKKDDFIISDMENRTITWYTCGPTVYDKSHMGHARSYVGFDIIRRIVEDYFQYNVMYIINVTDVDDKIIKKANRVLLAKFTKTVDDAVSAAAASQSINQELLGYLEEVKQKLIFDEQTKERTKQLTTPQIVELTARLRLLVAQHAPHLITKEQLEEQPDFVGVARHNEDLFWRDMKDLQVRYPSVVTRVTEYVPQIVDFVKKIIENGYAYESNGSVYFDTARFKQGAPAGPNGLCCSHAYGKLEPWSVNDADKAAEGEGEWASTNASAVQSEKRNAQDFALWKKSKDGEPAWQSPWGLGRPGWHIECSAMASHVVQGPRLDVHCGGVDLRFPHHDNELAQSEAHFENQQWVNYFMHAGHLHIEGMSMSKSKKNFITIQDALTAYNSRQIRMLFLMRTFDAPMDYSKENMDNAIQKERFFNEFFQNIKSVLREADAAFGRSEIWEQATEFELHKKLLQTKAKVHDALCDSFDTPEVLRLLQELVNDTNRYLVQTAASKSAKAPLLRAIAGYITHIFRVFGLIDSIDAIGFPVVAGAGADGAASGEAAIAPFLDAMSSFRDKVREAARAKKDHKELLQLCDSIRDDVLPELGVRLEDRSIGEPAVWKLEDKQVLLMERERAKQEAEEKQRAKDEAKRKKDEEERKKMEEAKISPKDMFRLSQEPRYTQFDDEGLPTHVINGQTGAEEEVSKSQRKNLKKQQDRQAKLHQQYLSKINGATPASAEQK